MHYYQLYSGQTSSLQTTSLPVLFFEICHCLLQHFRLRISKDVHSKPRRKVVAVVLIEGRNLLECVRRELEHCLHVSSSSVPIHLGRSRPTLQVRLDARRGDGFGQDHDATLDNPAENYLRWCFIELFCKFSDHRILDCHGQRVDVVAEGTIRFDHNALHQVLAMLWARNKTTPTRLSLLTLFWQYLTRSG